MLSKSTRGRVCDDTGEIVVELKDGYTLRSSSETFLAGGYVRLCDPAGKELYYWSYDEWQNDPELVMGAIIMASSGLAEPGERIKP